MRTGHARQGQSVRLWQGKVIHWDYVEKIPPNTLYLSSSCLGPRQRSFGRDLLLIENGSAWLAVLSFQLLPRKYRKSQRRETWRRKVKSHTQNEAPVISLKDSKGTSNIVFNCVENWIFTRSWDPSCCGYGSD